MTPGFQNLPIQSSSYDGQNIVITAPVIYITRAGETIIIPIGATSDGPSIPPAFLNIISPFGRHWAPAVLHDYLYRLTQFPKDKCDSLFFEAMELQGVEKVLKDILYDAVHLFGHIAFEEDRAVQKNIS